MIDVTVPRDEPLKQLLAVRPFASGTTGKDDRAGDQVQETSVTAWTKSGPFTVGTNPRMWLFTIFRSIVRSLQRQQRHQVSDPDGRFAATPSNVAAHDARFALHGFRATFDQLSAEHRESLMLGGASKLSCGEAAEVMDVTVDAVRSRANRACAERPRLSALTDGEAVISVADTLRHAIPAREVAAGSDRTAVA